jgi:hypothetical protein
VNDCVIMGTDAGQTPVFGERNVMLGSAAGELAGTSCNNIFVGFKAGQHNNAGKRVRVLSTTTSDNIEVSAWLNNRTDLRSVYYHEDLYHLYQFDCINGIYKITTPANVPFSIHHISLDVPVDETKSTFREKNTMGYVLF